LAKGWLGGAKQAARLGGLLATKAAECRGCRAGRSAKARGAKERLLLLLTKQAS
jgi:hypothetical protein